MIASIKAEFQKLLTVRSTYILIGLGFALEMLFAFYATGWRAQPAMLADPHFMSSQVTSALNVIMLLAAIAAMVGVATTVRPPDVSDVGGADSVSPPRSRNWLVPKPTTPTRTFSWPAAVPR